VYTPQAAPAYNSYANTFFGAKTTDSSKG
jgi:hypothetical protein